MKHCGRCNIVHVNLECPLCAAKATIEKMRVVVKAAPLMLEALKEIVKEGLELRKGGALALVIIAQAAIDVAEGKESNGTE